MPGTNASETTDRLAPPAPATRAPAAVRRYTMGRLVRRRTPITELLRPERWLGDVTPWSRANPDGFDVPAWVLGARRTPRTARPKTRAVVLLGIAASSILSASGYLFIAGR